MNLDNLRKIGEIANKQKPVKKQPSSRRKGQAPVNPTITEALNPVVVTEIDVEPKVFILKNRNRLHATVYEVSAILSKRTGLSDRLIRRAYLSYTALPVSTLSHLLKVRVSSLMQSTTNKYRANKLVKRARLDYVILFQSMDKDGNPIEGTGIDGIIVNNRLYDYIKSL